MEYKQYKLYALGTLAAGAFSLVYFEVPLFSIEYDQGNSAGVVIATTTPADDRKEVEKKEDLFVVTHVSTPEPIKAIYMTSWVAGTRDLRERLVGIIEETEINAVVIDIKDYSGRIAFDVHDPVLDEVGAEEHRIAGIKELIGALHEKDIYVIGRVSVFQDPFYTAIHPEFAVKKDDNRKEVWKDYKGLSFVDVSAKPFWDYIAALAIESYEVGFDEINFDYVRFPSDGNMSNVYYPYSEKMVTQDPEHGKARALEASFSYLHDELKDTDIVMSVDLFGMTMTNTDDLNIGQVLERAAPYFDYIAPMVYPSHYPPTFHGFANPNDYPYEVVNVSLSEGVRRLEAASTSPSKLRPWLQDFDYGGDYTAADVRAQIQATYDAGLTSWMLWDPANVYTKEALQKE